MSNNDLISRAAAIECAIDAVDDWDGGWNPNRETVIRKHFEELPAVDAEPVRHGYDKSSDYPYCDFKCSACDKEIKEFWADYKIDYCPFCGAKVGADDA